MPRSILPTDKRLEQLLPLLNDWDNTELGPLDRQDLREAVIELLQVRRGMRAAVPEAALRTPNEQAAA